MVMALDSPKDYCVLLVDVGPSNHSCLPAVEQFLVRFIEAKVRLTAAYTATDSSPKEEQVSLTFWSFPNSCR